MKKLTLFVNRNNYTLRFQDFISKKKNTTHASSIITFYESLPVSLLNCGDKAKTQTLKRRLERNISLNNVYVAVDSNHLLAFDPSKSIAIAYDFESRELYAATCSNGDYNDEKDSFTFNADASLVTRVTIDRLFATKPFIDPREDELLILRKQVADLQKQNDEKDIMIAELKRIEAEYNELVAAKQSLERQVEEEHEHSTVLDMSTNTIETMPLVSELKSNWCELASWQRRLDCERLSANEEQSLRDDLHHGFRWFNNYRSKIGLQMPIELMYQKPLQAISTIKSTIEVYEEELMQDAGSR
ncbi:hypothetical protein [Vibrio parahaemolyticus]|uniref:hypothetical protein n=1 Tax=Vibrio parahaemolyticus TaxID=670 RepID=UPI0011220064|nr:hypothetical protein [Vibrio parahaemolyticus]EGS6497194.1 hypothetical protein [Vibrio parahaemolyticus]ELF4876479.1 hypothetical protein [Vibrio parahaemolyticus]TOE16207.1 hypothetical protein CGJ50_02080 [Vibrio parahaemolyticus]TOJ04440.1 hypothetical protein CGI48_09305 [Vibrio parahaemolyticus]